MTSASDADVRQWIAQTAASLLEIERDDPRLSVGCVLLSWLFVGRHAIRASKLLQIDRLFCVRIGLNMRRAGRWHDGIFQDWQNKDDFIARISFVIDAMIGSGELTCIGGRTFDTMRLQIAKGGTFDVLDMNRYDHPLVHSPDQSVKDAANG